MKKHVLAFVLLAVDAAFAATLEEGFRNPPDSAKPHTWYHMMNGNITKEGITCDFEAIAKAGIGGVQMFDAGCNVPAGPLAFNTPEWFELMRHAASEARRLGLEICIPTCSGWSSSGGPWVAPSNGMKKVVFSETQVKGPAAFRRKLPREERDNGFYEDIAVLAFPTPPADLAEIPGVKIDLAGKTALLSAKDPFTAQGLSYRLDYPGLWGGAAMFKIEMSKDGETYRQIDKYVIPLAQSGVADRGIRYHQFAHPVTARAFRLSFLTSQKVTVAEAWPERKLRISDAKGKSFDIRNYDVAVRRDTAKGAADQVVRKDAIHDLTDRLAPDGTLAWDVPAGDWTILRFGHVCNGRCNHPASAKGKGLEVDKLCPSALDFHFSQYIARLCDHLGPLAGDVKSGLNNILVDSYEVGSQNWTQGFDRTFEARTGYPIRPWLPVLTGRVVGSVDESERFLEDFRRVIADLFAESYAGRLAALCHARGLKLSLEPYGNAPADNLQYGQDVDIPMGEYWSFAGKGDHETQTCNARFPSYLAHVWGRRVAATESFTAGPNDGGRWQTTPFAIKAQGDRVYAEGVNRIIYHRFTHQPWPGNRYLPGMTMGRWGMHLDRTQTWWPLAGDWFRYQARCQWMLQEGTFVADVLHFCGEGAPNQGGNTHENRKADADIRLPAGYAWDVCATKALHLLKVVDGRVVVPGGVSYALLALPGDDTMSEKALRTVERLIDAGAKVCCPAKPKRSPGMAGYPTADGRVRALADRVWAKGVMECKPAEALERLGVAPDFASTETDPQTGAVYIHRRAAGADWYFVALNNAEAKSFEASFRVAGRQPEIWDAEKGTVADASTWRVENGRTVVRLDFPPSGSAFVIFRKAGTDATAGTNATGGTKATDGTNTPISGPWRVTFPVEWYTGGKAVKTIAMTNLADWTSFDDPDVKYFSGTATYRKNVKWKMENVKLENGERVMLDLGAVKNFAVVTVNGRTFPVLWRPPYRVDITEVLDAKADAFTLEVKVTNLWPNRLIGDDALPPDCEWKGSVRNGVKEIGVKEIPQWVKDGKRSPTGRHTFTTWRHWAKDEPLLPSGLLGPVFIRTGEIAREGKTGL